MVLDEVYAPFWALFSNERLLEVRGILSGDSGVDGASLEKALREFVTAAQRFLQEGDYAPFKGEANCKAISPKDAVDEFNKNLKAYAVAFASASSAAKSAKNDKSFASGISAYLAEGSELAAFIYGYAVFQLAGAVLGAGASGADAAGLVEHWALDRKFREACQAAGVSGDKAYRVAEIAKVVLRRVKPASGENYSAVIKGDLSPLNIITSCSDDEDFRRILGINEWEGTTWFNKESFGEALFFAAAFALEYGKLSEVSAIVEKLTKAEVESGYKLDELIHHLGGKKPAAAKTAAPKTEAAKPAPAPKAAAPAAPKASAAKPAAPKSAAAKPATKSTSSKTSSTKSGTSKKK
jgi:hypothetical protein